MTCYCLYVCVCVCIHVCNMHAICPSKPYEYFKVFLEFVLGCEQWMVLRTNAFPILANANNC